MDGGDDTIIAKPGEPRTITGTLNGGAVNLRVVGAISGDRPTAPTPPVPWWRRWWRRVTRR